MKLSLTTEKNIYILAIESWQSEVSAEPGSPESLQATQRDIQVLKAGLVKLMTAGKNRIIVELPNQFQDLPADAIRELAAFDRLASELSGRIVLAQVQPELGKKIAAFAKPPVVVCFPTRAAALNFFQQAPEEEPKVGKGVGVAKVPPGGGGPDPKDAKQSAPSPAGQEGKKSGKAVQDSGESSKDSKDHKDPKEQKNTENSAPPSETTETKLRERVAFLEAENTRLLEQVVLTTLSRKNDGLSSEAVARIQNLESKIAKLLEENARLSDPRAAGAAPKK